MPPQEVDKRQAAREVIDILHEIATLLNTNLNRTQLSFCVSLIENGVNPEALASSIRLQNVIRELREQYPEPLEPELGDEEGEA
ncbi:Mitotic-spindle organizing protein [Neofusicoccum parvum]|uniref:Mitotic-spindle organizing protein 1 n=2 Tax=Neofusicoccum parvum TaxID=310453 RepID=R1FWU1_BOTPV|nr:putative mitotic-spindle organizing protein 1 protein [Neofusicoccum parvum UCRNP2]GME27241.1 Mitotic-spindle organizing protein [Neofusicoccum parvum]GME57314.1 Mitotic-spindle organizing protein [Neofusicoccum parvum]